MAPRQVTQRQVEAIVGQIETLIDSLDFKALDALYQQYLSQANASLSAAEIADTYLAKEVHLSDANIAEHRCQQVRVIYHAKKHRVTIRQEYTMSIKIGGSNV